MSGHRTGLRVPRAIVGFTLALIVLPVAVLVARAERGLHRVVDLIDWIDPGGAA